MIADKAGDVGGVIADKADYVAEVTKDKVVDASVTAKDFTVRKGKEVGSAAAEKAGQVCAALILGGAQRVACGGAQCV